MAKAKKVKTKTKPRATLASVRNTIRRSLAEALDAVTDNSKTEVALPSVEAMSLAESVLDRIARNAAVKGARKKEATQIVVAEMLDATLRVRRTHAEAGGIQKGVSEATERFERQIINGVMMRIGGFANFKKGSTIALARHEAELLFRVLQKAGYRPQFEQESTARQETPAEAHTRWVRVPSETAETRA